MTTEAELAELESDHNLGEHGPGRESAFCPVCTAISKTEAAMAAAARLNELVTEEWCFICRRLTDHRGEHELDDLDDEPRTVSPALEDHEPWSGGFATNH